ncbi:MAG: hypothetical protein JWN73_1277 [Betaproteobacteria bacterium]|nr:hypothetical protein [Betaproteobacteria bacterium]
MSIRPEEYHSAEVFARERERVFGSRLFAGSAWRFDGPDAYRAYLAGNHALVTRKAGDRFHTLDNVCLHRGNLIHPLGYGEKPLRCGYHAWQYAPDGALSHAPLADPACIARKQLQSYPTAELRGLLFADLSGRAPALEAARRVLDRIGFDLDAGARPFRCHSVEHRANWKLLVENVTEAYHVSFLHGPSFVSQGYASAGGYEWGAEGDCSWHVMHAKEGLDARVRRLIPQSHREFTHAFVYPNLFVAVTSGLIAYIGHFLPTSAGTTLLETELYETPLLMRQKDAIREHFKAAAGPFSALVIEEDRVQLESSQLGLPYARGPHQLVPAEARVGHFQKTYREAMDAV